MIKFKLSKYGVVLAILITTSFSIAQNNNLVDYQYISPVPNSALNLAETNIIIREGKLIDQAILFSNNITVTGSVSGNHFGELILSDDSKTIIFKPYEKFYPAETVNVSYVGGIFNLSGDELPPFNFHFGISERDPDKEYIRNADELLEYEGGPVTHSSGEMANLYSSKLDDNLPDDFPTLTINISNNPDDNYLFLSPFDITGTLGYLIISDNYGIPIYYRRTNSYKHGFRVQPNGLLTYFDVGTRRFYAMDSSYVVVDTFNTGNGYTTDMHELQILPDGHSLLMAHDLQPVRMDTVIEGGNSDIVTVVGLIIQELDINKKVVFQWRSWDHFKITDVTEDIHFDWQWIDYVHGNAIELDYDGNLLISSRNMDEITKINRQTGEIIWRLGGKKARNNDFTFINDPVTFSHQHDIRRLPNGNIILFDNGNLHSPKFSRAVEYQLDEDNHIANLIWNYSSVPSVYSWAMASAQRLSNHNTIIGWGIRTEDLRAISEVKADGTVVFELALPDTMFSYRAFRFPWKTNLFITDPDSIFFESIPVGSSSIITISLINNTADSLNITSFYNKDSSYSVEKMFPFNIPPFGAVPINIKFEPFENGYFKDFLHIRSDTETSRIAQVMVMGGRTDSTISSFQDRNPQLTYRLEQNYPNPFNPSTVIQYQISKREFVTLRVYDILGREVATLVNAEKPAGNYNVEFKAQNLTSGVYIYRLQAGDFSSIKKLILLK